MDQFTPVGSSPEAEEERSKVWKEIAQQQTLGKTLMGFLLLIGMTVLFIWLPTLSGGWIGYIFGYFMAAICGYAALLTLGVLWQRFIGQINREN